MKWTYAKSYAKIAPHEWVLREDAPAFFKRMKGHIKKGGVREPFTLHGKMNWYRYWYRGRYKYWIIMNILNRAKIK